MWRSLPQLRGADAGARGVPSLSRADDRERLRLVRSLRSIARRANRGGRARHYEVLLCGRAVAVRWDLLEIAAMLERVSDPPPDALLRLRWLLSDGCTSPLYNPKVDVASLTAALDQVRSELVPGDVSPFAAPELVPQPKRKAASRLSRGLPASGPPRRP